MSRTTQQHRSDALHCTLQELTGLELPPQRNAHDARWEKICAATVSDLHETLKRREPGEQTAVTDMVAALVRTAGDPFIALVDDVADILFLPRAERSEYRNHRLKSPPFVIEKLLLEYAIFAAQLDDLMARLNKSFCETQCPSPPVGCCHLLGYDLGLVPDRMLEVQRLEAIRNGWRAPVHPDLEKCRYHMPTGCALRLFKSPACLGAMCAAVERHLDATCPPAYLKALREKLQSFRNCDIDRTEVFEAMQALIEVGNGLSYRSSRGR